MIIFTMMTTWYVGVCGLHSLVGYFNVGTHDIWEGHVTTRRGIQIEHIRSLGFWDIRKGTILQRLECALIFSNPGSPINFLL